MTPLDEFNASFLAYKNAPNLSEEERMMLLEHAYEIAKDGNLTKEIEICKDIKKNLYENK